MTVCDMTLDDFIFIFPNKECIVDYDGVQFKLSELKLVSNDLRVLDIQIKHHKFKLKGTDNELCKVYLHFKKYFDNLIFKDYYTGKLYDKEILYCRSPLSEITSIEYLPYSDRLLIEFKDKYYE